MKKATKLPKPGKKAGGKKKEKLGTMLGGKKRGCK